MLYLYEWSDLNSLQMAKVWLTKEEQQQIEFQPVNLPRFMGNFIIYCMRNHKEVLATCEVTSPSDSEKSLVGFPKTGKN